MQVGELRSVRGLSNFQLAAGGKGLQREMHSVVIFEYESIKVENPHYYEGDFLITSLVFAKDRPELVAPAIQRMCALGASGIAIKTIYYSQLPAEAVETADAYQVPIFLFQDIYIEKVILCINEYLCREQDFARYEHELEQMLTQNISEHLVKSMCMVIFPAVRTKILALFLKSSFQEQRETAKRLLGIMISQGTNQMLADLRILQYQDGIFILYTFDEAYTVRQAGEKVFSRLCGMGLQPAAYGAGISDIHAGAETLDLCIRESYYAQQYGCLRENSRAYYQELGIFQLVLPMLNDKSAMRAYRRLFGKLREYDAQANSCLTETLCTYAACSCEVQKTARTLCQHPNTIRYRLNRAEEVLDELPEGSFPHVAYWLAAIHSMEGNPPHPVL